MRFVIAATLETWERRIRRSDILEARWPFAAEALRFFRAVTAFQQDVHARLSSSAIINLTSQNLKSPSDRFRLDLLVPFVPALLDLVARDGPPRLAAHAGALRVREAAEWKQVLEAYRRGGAEECPKSNVQGRSEASDAGPWTLDAFFARALLQPALAAVAARGNHPSQIADRPSHATPLGARRQSCPSCGHPPVVGVLREDIEAGATARTLVCSLCAAAWAYPRVLCPACGEEDPEKLPRYTAQEIPWVRVEGCDACRRYLKVVDLTQEAEAEPVTDEIGSTPLDVIARERGYAKITRNLLGI